MRADPRSHARLVRPFAQHIEHLLLKIHGHNSPGIPYLTSRSDREEPHPAPEVQDGHSWPQVRF
jgi:hypothetical protein